MRLVYAHLYSFVLRFETLILPSMKFDTYIHKYIIYLIKQVGD